MLRAMTKERVLDRLFMITPSWGSNKPLITDPKYPLPIDEEDVYHDPDDITCIDAIIAKVEAEARDYNNYKDKQKKYEDLRKAMQNINSDRQILDVDPEILINAYNHGAMEPPKSKYNGRKPVLALLVDDSQVIYALV